MRRLLILIAPALLLAACTPDAVASAGSAAPPVVAGAPPAPTALDPVTAAGTKALIVAEEAYRVAAKGVLPLLGTRITGPAAAEVQRINAIATAALKAGYAAKTAADMASQVAALVSATNALKATAPGG